MKWTVMRGLWARAIVAVPSRDTRRGPERRAPGPAAASASASASEPVPNRAIMRGLCVGVDPGDIVGESAMRGSPMRSARGCKAGALAASVASAAKGPASATRAWSRRQARLTEAQSGDGQDGAEGGHRVTLHCTTGRTVPPLHPAKRAGMGKVDPQEIAPVTGMGGDQHGLGLERDGIDDDPRSAGSMAQSRAINASLAPPPMKTASGKEGRVKEGRAIARYRRR
jgi:hypothetical protein